MNTRTPLAVLAFLFAFCLIPVFGQNVVTNPTATQTITQPSGTNFAVSGTTVLGPTTTGSLTAGPIFIPSGLLASPTTTGIIEYNKPLGIGSVPSLDILSVGNINLSSSATTTVGNINATLSGTASDSFTVNDNNSGNTFLCANTTHDYVGVGTLNACGPYDILDVSNSEAFGIGYMHWFQSGTSTWDAGISHPASATPAAVLSFDALVNGDALATLKAGASQIVNSICPLTGGLDGPAYACDFLNANYSLFPSQVDDSSYMNLNATGPGGNTGGFGATRVSNVLDTTIYNNARGISHGIRILMNHNGTGDTAGIYLNNNFDGGSPDASGEGESSGSFKLTENSGYYHGTVTTGGMGTTTPTLTFTSGQNHTTDGTFLLDITKGTLAGNLTGGNTALTGTTYLSYLPVHVTAGGSTLPLTTAWGSLSTGLPATYLAANQSIAATNVSVTLNTISGSTPAFGVGIACAAGTVYPEQIYISAASSVSGGTQMITFNHRSVQPAGSVIFQGGICGQYLTFPADLTVTNQRSAYYAFGSLTGTDLIYGFYGLGANRQGLPRTGVTPESTTAAFALYPGAEIVQNQPSGSTVQLEPNGVNWAVNDVVEDPHYPFLTGNGLWVDSYQETPPTPGYSDAAETIVAQGPGVSATYNPLLIDGNGTSASCPSYYTYCGGLLSPPFGAELVNGFFTSDLRVQFAPGILGANSLPVGGMISVESGTSPFVQPLSNIFYDETFHGALYYDFSGSSTNATFHFVAPSSSAPMTYQGSPICTVANGLCPLSIVGSLVTTSSTSDTVTMPGMTSTGHCSQPGATNASASTAVGTYISSKTSNHVTVTHAATSGMTYDLICTAY